MTTLTPTAPAPAAASRPAWRGALRRLTALARAELTLLVRNKVAVFYAVLAAPVFVLALGSSGLLDNIADVMPGGGMTTMLVVLLVLMGMSMSVYINVTTAVVARREALVLKRLRTGESRAWEILTAVATPNVMILLAQVVLVTAALAVVLEAPALTNPLVAALGVLLGGVVFAELAYLTGVRTRTVESAQLTTMPLFILSFFASGFIIPLPILPDAVAAVLRYLPVYPVTELVTIGVGGATMAGEPLDLAATFAAAAQPLAVMAVWAVVLGYAAARYMRWEPRR
ncbi:ABC transporter permease [Georgenia sp. TF02-10]|uniref:ABC transporter permease n=1 Tax=Georgenia sp. TF02-10 TaxID=2917725 RepID=UPI001FA72E21|nr:ABC transporter permease [Georgenia sp. TF02-10]UNX54792.1 ABC transporter permease [Georgenia sp. TF02-10]